MYGKSVIHSASANLCNMEFTSNKICQYTCSRPLVLGQAEWVNSVDPDQTALEAVLRESALFATLPEPFGHIARQISILE